MSIIEQVAQRDPSFLQHCLSEATLDELDAAMRECIRVGHWPWVKTLMESTALLSVNDFDRTTSQWVIEAVRRHGSEQGRQVRVWCRHSLIGQSPSVESVLQQAVAQGSLHAYEEIKVWPEMQNASWLLPALAALKGGTRSAHRVMFKDIWPHLKNVDRPHVLESGWRQGRHDWLVTPFRSLLPTDRVALAINMMARMIRSANPKWETRFWSTIERHPAKISHGLGDFKTRVTAGLLELAQGDLPAHADAWRRLLPQVEVHLLWEVLPSAIERKLEPFAEALWQHIRAPEAPSWSGAPWATRMKALSAALSTGRLDWCDRVWSADVAACGAAGDHWDLLFDATDEALGWVAARLDWIRLEEACENREPLKPADRLRVDQALAVASSSVREAWLAKDATGRLWPLAQARQEAERREAVAIHRASPARVRGAHRPRS